MLTGSTATLGRLTAPHREGYTTPGPSLRWIVTAFLYPETVSLRISGECLWVVVILTYFCGLLPSLTEGVSDRREVR